MRNFKIVNVADMPEEEREELRNEFDDLDTLEASNFFNDLMRKVCLDYDPEAILFHQEIVAKCTDKISEVLGRPVVV